MTALEACREANVVLGVACTAMLCYRAPQALQSVWSPRLFVVLALFVPTVALASGVNVAISHPASPLTPLFTLLFVAVLWVCTFWPSRPPSR